MLFRSDDIDLHGGADALADAGEVAGAEVLPAERGHGLAHGDEALGEDVLDAPGGREGGDGDGAELVDGRLFHEGPGSCDGELEGHGDAHPELVGGRLPVKAPVAPRGHKRPDPEADVSEAEGGRDALGKDGGARGAVHAHAEPDDKGKIQEDVQKGRKNEEKQRHPAVSDSAQDGGEQVIEHGRGKAQTDDAHVELRVRQDVRGGAHEHQKARHARESGEGQERREDHGELDPVGDADPQGVCIFCAE